jgi:hypothetical protein
MEKNKTGKYLKYAIGEIILVVIGILIALGINNWNEVRKETNKERQIITNLHQEFIQNKQIIESIKDGIKLSSNSCHTLMNLLNEDVLEASTQNIDSLIYLSLEHKPFIPSNSVFSEIIEAGNINLITEESLKKKLFKWSTEIENIQARYLVFEKWIEDGYLPYLSKNISLKNIDKYSPMAWEKKSKFESDYNVIFKEREFENIIDNTLYHQSLMTQLYDNVDSLINEIIIHTNTMNKK